jgi:3-oxoadipate enol-lactonase
MTQRVLERVGCPIHYWLHGDSSKPLLVFTHGAGADHQMFDSQITALEQDFQILTWDVRGHGRSRPMGVFSLQLVLEDLLAILDAIGAKQAIFIGQSMGGNISQALVQQFPERVLALVLVDCVCNTMPLGWLERFALQITPALLKLYPHQALINQSANASARRLEVRAYLQKTMSVLSKPELETVLLETTRILQDNPTYCIPKPFLLLRGQFDNAGAIAKAPAWAAREPNCRGYKIIPDAGHCSNQDNPVFFNAVLLEFLQAFV